MALVYLTSAQAIWDHRLVQTLYARRESQSARQQGEGGAHYPGKKAGREYYQGPAGVFACACKKDSSSAHRSRLSSLQRGQDFFRNASVVIWRSVQSKFSSVSVAPLYGFWRTFGEEPGADVDLDG